MKTIGLSFILLLFTIITPLNAAIMQPGDYISFLYDRGTLTVPGNVSPQWFYGSNGNDSFDAGTSISWDLFDENDVFLGSSLFNNPSDRDNLTVSGGPSFTTDTLRGTFVLRSIDATFEITSWGIAFNTPVGFTGNGSRHDDQYISNNIVRNTIPEPATMLLFGFGLLGIAGVGRRKK